MLDAEKVLYLEGIINDIINHVLTGADFHITQTFK